jgi:hypothetical protein
VRDATERPAGEQPAGEGEGGQPVGGGSVVQGPVRLVGVLTLGDQDAERPVHGDDVVEPRQRRTAVHQGQVGVQLDRGGTAGAAEEAGQVGGQVDERPGHGAVEDDPAARLERRGQHGQRETEGGGGGVALRDEGGGIEGDGQPGLDDRELQPGGARHRLLQHLRHIGEVIRELAEVAVGTARQTAEVVEEALKVEHGGLRGSGSARPVVPTSADCWQARGRHDGPVLVRPR